MSTCHGSVLPFSGRFDSSIALGLDLLGSGSLFPHLLEGGEGAGGASCAVLGDLASSSPFPSLLEGSCLSCLAFDCSVSVPSQVLVELLSGCCRFSWLLFLGYGFCGTFFIFGFD